MTLERIRSARPGVAIAATIAALAGSTVGCGGASRSSQPVHFEQKEWQNAGLKGTELDSQHYSLRTTIRDKTFHTAIPKFLEDCWNAYATLIPFQGTLREPLLTYLFQQRWEWERFTEQFAPERAPTYKRIRSGGYSERGVTVSHYSSRTSTLSVLAHEGLHQYLEVTRGTAVPSWLNEGLACYFEGFNLEEDGHATFTPEYNPLRSAHLREALTKDQLIPLREVLATHAGREVQKQSGRVRSYYAQEWSLVLYLLEPAHKNPYHDAFRRMLDEIGGDEMRRKVSAYRAADTDDALSEGEAAFRAYITEDLERFESRYVDYIREMLGMNS